jgi:peptide/nickel transport system substrate-binding protein
MTRVPALLSILLLAGCHCSHKAGPGEGGDAIVVLVESEVGSLDPRFAASSYEIKISRLVHSGLMSADTEDLGVEPLLAESVERIDDAGRTWRVTLRPGLTFHDGTPVTSRDVVATFASVRDPRVGSRYRATYSYITHVEAEGRLSVRFRLAETNASFLPDLVMPILPAHVLEKADGMLGDEQMVGCGPYRLAGRSKGRIVLEPHGREGPPVVFLLVRDDNARVLRFEGGGADLAQNNVPVHLLQLFEGRDDVRVLSGPGASFTYVGVNTEAERLDDVRVREALLVAIDREAVVTHKLRGRGRVASGMLPPMHWAYREGLEGYPYDPQRAMRLLDEAGYPDPPGREPRFRLAFKTSSNRFRLAMARVIASYWEAVGIEVDLRPFEFSTLRSHLNSGAFEVTCLQIPMVMEPNLYRWFFHSSSIPSGAGSGGANRWRYASDEADALIEQGVRVVDVQERRKVYGTLQEVLARDLPVLPLWHEDNVAVVSARLAGYRLLPTAPFTPLADVSP